MGSDEISQGHISGRQLMMLLAFFMGTKVLYFFPTVMSMKSGSSAWLSIVVSTGVALLGLWGWLLWIGVTGESGFVVSLRETCGRLLGDAIATAILALLVMMTALNTRLFTGGAVIGVVPAFSMDALIWISSLSAIYAAWLGIESVGRAAGFFFTPTLLSLGMVMLSLSKTFDIANLNPFWGFGAKNTVVQGLVSTGMFGGIIAVPIVKSYVRKQEGIPKRSVNGTLIAAAVLILGLVSVAGMFPYPMSARKVEPLSVMARSVYLGRFVQRIESLFIFTWYFSTSVQTSFSYALILILLSQLSGTGTYRPFVPAVAILTFGVAALPANTLMGGQLMDRFFTTTGGTVLVFLGWALYALAAARGIPSAAGGESQSDDGRQKAKPTGR